MAAHNLTVTANDKPEKETLTRRYNHKSLKSITWQGSLKSISVEERVDNEQFDTLVLRAILKSEKEFRLSVQLSQLTLLNLDNNHLVSFPPVELLKHLPSLTQLILSRNSIDIIPSDALAMIAEFARLQELDLSHNKLARLPKTIGLLTTLTVLKLEGNDLIELPEEIINLTQLKDDRKSFSIKGNKLVRPPQKLSDTGGWRTIRWELARVIDQLEDEFWIKFNEDANNKGKPDKHSDKKFKGSSFQVKLQVLGSSGAGKTKLVSALLFKAKAPVDTANETNNEDDSHLNSNSNDYRPQRPQRPQRQFSSSNSSNNDDDSSYSHDALSIDTSGARSGGLAPLAPATPLLGRDTGSLNRVRTRSSSSASAAASVATSRRALLGLAVHTWHPNFSHLDRFLTTQCVTPGQPPSKTASRINSLTLGATYSCRIWDLSGSLSSSFTVHRLLMTDYSLFLIVWDLRLCTPRDWEDHVVRYIRFVLASGVSNFRILIAGSHADCLDTEEIKANIYKLRAYLSSAGYTQHVESIILPFGEGDERRLSYLSAQLAYVLVTHSGRYAEMLKAVRKDENRMAQYLAREDSHYCFVQDRNSVLQRQVSQLVHSPLEYTKSPFSFSAESRQVKRAEEEALAQAVSLVRIGEAVSFQLLRQDLLVKVDWLVARLRRLLDRPRPTTPATPSPALASPDRPAVFTRDAIEDLLSDPSVPSADHKALLRCLFVSLGVLVPIPDASLPLHSTPSPSLRSADDMSVGSGAPRLSRSRHKTDDLGGPAGPWTDNVFAASTYLVPLLLPALPADRDFRKPGYVCLERRFLYSHPSAVLSPAWFVLACLQSRQQCLQTQLGFFSWKAWDRAFLMEVQARLDVNLLVTLEDLRPARPLASLAPGPPPFRSGSSEGPGAPRGSRSYASPPLGQSQSSFKPQAPQTPQTPSPPPPPPPPLPPLPSPPPPLPQASPPLPATSSLPPQTPLPWGTHAASLPSGAGSVLRIRVFCHPLHTQTSLRVLRTFCQAMHACLEGAHDLRRVFSQSEPSSSRAGDVEDSSSHIRLVVTCPECLQSYRHLHTAHDSDCGQFSYDEVVVWEKEFCLDTPAATAPPPPGSLHQPSGSLFSSSGGAGAGAGGLHRPPYDKSMAEFFYHLSKRRILCPKRRCAVRPDMLFDIPAHVQRFIEQSKQFTQTSRFLTDEVIRRGMQKDHACAVKVMVVTLLEDSLAALAAGSADRAGTPPTCELTVKPKAVCSGAMCSVPVQRGDSCGGTADAVFAITCEHVMTESEFDQEERRYHYADKFQTQGLAILFLVGDENEWLFIAELVYKGSAHPAHAKRFHDYCVLRLLCPIRKQTISTADELVTIQPYKSALFAHVGVEHVCVRTGPSLSEASIAHDTLPLARPRSVSLRSRPLRVKHPQFAGHGALAVAQVSTRTLTGDQCVCLLSYPQNKSLSVDFGRILQHDPKDEDILLEVLSDRGSSGGPLLDVYGQVVGVLSRSYNTIKYSFVQPIRELPAILSKSQHLFSLGE